MARMSEFATSKHCRFSGLEPLLAQAILGALKCLQNRFYSGLSRRTVPERAETLRNGSGTAFPTDSRAVSPTDSRTVSSFDLRQA